MNGYSKGKASFVPDRKNLFLSICDLKRVLHVGCGPPSIPWFFDEITGIAKVAKEYMGIDIRSNNVKRLWALSLNAICGDAEKVDLGKKFDVIMGMPLEHVSNQGMFLENMKRHLEDEGVMVVSVPHISCVKYMLWQLLGKFKKLQFDSEHVLWHSEETLRAIVERHGWKVKEIYYSYLRPRPRWKKVLASAASRFIPPRYIGSIIVAVLEKI
jgi:2-polyprenyl-3-methyl-5-hydroxy-6-metoxy-1,4-benzoquinol methylase